MPNSPSTTTSATTAGDSDSGAALLATDGANANAVAVPANGAATNGSAANGALTTQPAEAPAAEAPKPVRLGEKLLTLGLISPDQLRIARNKKPPKN